MSTKLLQPPGPRGNPVLGSIRELQRDNVQAFMDGFRHHGDIVNFRGPLKVVLLAHPDYVHHVMRAHHKKYPRPGKVQACLSTIVGDGLVAAEGKSWLRSRRTTQPAFHHDILRDFAGTFTSSTAEMLDDWQRRSRRGRPIDVKSEMMHLSLTNLARALFKADLTDDINRIEPAVAGALAYTNKRFTTPIDPLRVPGKARDRFHRHLDVLNSVLYRLVKERREAGGHDDLVSLLINAPDPETGETFTDEMIRDEISGFFVAGHETVSSALTWTAYLLSVNPESRRRLQHEVDTALCGRVPTVDDLPKLTYTTMVLKEAMRHYPPIFTYMRMAAEDDTIGGYHIPKGRWVTLCPYVTHRHPEFWENPEGFDPERFTPEKEAARHRMAYYPFGAGPRRCIGDSFAMVQMPLVLAMIAQRFRLDLVEGQTVFPQPALSLRPRDPLMMWLRPVEGVAAW